MTRVVALHGFLGRPQDWDIFSKELMRLAPNIDFQAVDVLGAVDSPGSLAEWTSLFNQEQKEKHVERNILLGYSLGGRLGLQASLEKPGLWDEVVLVSTHPGLQSDDEKERRRVSDLDWAEKFETLPWHNLVKLWNGQPVFIESAEPERLEKDYNRKALSQALVSWSLAHQDFAEEALSALKPKLHWVVGEKDSKFRDLLQSLKKSGVVQNLSTIKGAGHRVLFDNPKELARLVVRRLKL